MLGSQKDEQVRVPEPMKAETTLEAEMTKPKRSYFGHIVRRQSSLEKPEMLGKQKAAGKEEDQI